MVWLPDRWFARFPSKWRKDGLQNPELRRRVTVGLNSEAHRTLKRPIHFYRKDSISDRTRLEQTDAMPLNMVVAAITGLPGRALQAMAERGTPVPDSLPAAHFARGLGAHRDHWNLHLEGLDQAVPLPRRDARLSAWGKISGIKRFRLEERFKANSIGAGHQVRVQSSAWKLNPVSNFRGTNIWTEKRNRV